MEMGSFVTSVIIPGVISWYVAKREITSKQTTTYKELITAERIKWLNNIREEICNLLSTAREMAINYIEESYILSDEEAGEPASIKKEKLDRLYDEYGNLINQLKRSVTKIVLCINPEKDIDFRDKVRKFSEDIYNMSRDTRVEEDGFGSLIEKMEEDCQDFLKREWEQIKEEAKAMIENNAS
jgi:hypothetical protein|nr:MAG TPA: hypothetical protein [Caudoviricetes sp.]